MGSPDGRDHVGAVIEALVLEEDESRAQELIDRADATSLDHAMTSVLRAVVRLRLGATPSIDVIRRESRRISGSTSAPPIPSIVVEAVIRSVAGRPEAIDRLDRQLVANAAVTVVGGEFDLLSRGADSVEVRREVVATARALAVSRG